MVYKDVVGAALLSNEISWWHNDGNIPVQWIKNPVANNFIASHKVCTYDFDGDLDFDILGTAYTNNQIAWWLNNGGSPVTWTKIIVDGNFPGAVIAYPADLDFDGDIDVVGTAQGSSQIAWWRNDDGVPISWTKFPLNLSFGAVWPLYLGDLDGDFDIDIVAGGNGANEIRWWENSYYNLDFDATPTSGHAALEVQFSDSSNLYQPINSWAWDFENDGVFDSFVQNPLWTYNSPGIYSVRLVVTCDSLCDTLIHKNYIKVFDGESALLFNNENSYALCPATPSINLTDSLTIEAWIKPYGWGENAMFGYGRIIDKNQISLYLINSHPAYNNQSLFVQLKHSNGITSRFSTADSSITLQDWQHIAFTYDGSLSTAKIYINGNEQPLTYSIPPSGDITDNSNNNLIIGNDPNLNSTFDGIIDEVRIWKTVRSSQEIQDNFTQYLTGNEQGLVGYWKMNEGYGDTLIDHSNNGNTINIFDTDWIQGSTFTPSSIKEPESVKLPNKFILHQNYPNPFNSETQIDYQLSSFSKVELKIYNSLGEIVRTLVNKQQAAGDHTIVWNGKYNSGKTVSSGIYIYRMQISNPVNKTISEQSKKMLLLK